MLCFSDLHLRPESEESAFAVLDRVRTLAADLGEDTVAFLGDWWHVRYALPIQLLNRVRDLLVSWTRSGIFLDILPGNHDQTDLNGRHALEVFDGLPGVTVHHSPTIHAHFHGTHRSRLNVPTVWVPYRREPRVLEEFLEDAPDGAVVFLHHGIAGARMNGGMQASLMDGLAPDTLARFRLVVCGHWHQHQVLVSAPGKANIVFVGSQWQTRADEAGQTKGVVQVDPQGSWRFHPIDVARRFHQVDASGALPVVAAGDVVRLSPDLPPARARELAARFTQAGAQVLVQKPPPVYAGPRLGDAVTLHEQAARYVAQAQIPEGLDQQQLLAAFDALYRGTP